LAGKVSELARAISAMPQRWQDALKGKGEIDLSAAVMNAKSQQLLIPDGLMSGVIKSVASKALGDAAHEIVESKWPKNITKSGFKGSIVHMDEPVLDIPSVIRTLAEMNSNTIRASDEGVSAKLHIYTAAEGNEKAAKKAGHGKGMETQARPLLMGMLKPAPFEIYAHLVGKSDKPVCTITTHKDKEGTLVWYLGAGVAERPKNASEREVFMDCRKAFKKFFPQTNFDLVQWATLPIDRIEGKSKKDGWMPDTPTIHEAGDVLYCWPTKLTFAPLLADNVIEKIQTRGLKPSGAISKWDHLSEAEIAETPWDEAQWKNY
jgi:plasmid stability protein